MLPGLGIGERLKTAIEQIDLYTAIVNGMLAFLLFAGALHVDIDLMKGQKWAIGLMATIGVVISTAIVGFGIFLACRLVGFDMPLIWALVFGGADLTNRPWSPCRSSEGRQGAGSDQGQDRRRIKLFNDGAAVVIFIALLMRSPSACRPATWWDRTGNWAASPRCSCSRRWAASPSASSPAGRLLRLHVAAFIDDPMVEILISIAGPQGHLCAVDQAACLRADRGRNDRPFDRRRGAEQAMSEKVKEYLFSFWAVVDEVPNSVLFLLIGPEVLVIGFYPQNSWMIPVAIPSCLRPLGLGLDPDHAALHTADSLARIDPDPHLGRPARRRFGGARAVAAADRVQADHPHRDLRGGDLLDHRRPDREMGDREDVGNGGRRARKSYSCRSASIRSRRAPRSAGKKPKAEA